MGITLSGLLAGFVLWLLLDWKFPASTERKALIVCLSCLMAGLAIGLWADGDTIRAITQAMHRGSVPKY